MRNLTVTLDGETARWVRLEAATHEVSVLRLVRDLLRERMAGSRAYRAAMRRYLAGEPSPLTSEGGYLSREDDHDRAALR